MYVEITIEHKTIFLYTVNFQNNLINLSSNHQKLTQIIKDENVRSAKIVEVHLPNS